MADDDDEPREPFGAKVVNEMLKSRLEAAAAQYGAIVNRLWAGCGGGLGRKLVEAKDRVGHVITLMRGPGADSLRQAVAASWS